MVARTEQRNPRQCRTCALHRDNKPEPLIATPLPDRPWQVVATDLFQIKGMDYLIVIDCYSSYVEVAAMTKTTKSSEVIRALKSIFARHGIPEQVRSDNGPQYDSAEFSHFANSGDLNTKPVVRDFHSLMEKSSVELERSRTSSRKLKTLPKNYLPTDQHNWPVNSLQPSC